jgi:hypothetical protein
LCATSSRIHLLTTYEGDKGYGFKRIVAYEKFRAPLGRWPVCRRSSVGRWSLPALTVHPPGPAVDPGTELPPQPSPVPATIPGGEERRLRSCGPVLMLGQLMPASSAAGCSFRRRNDGGDAGAPTYADGQVLQPWASLGLAFGPETGCTIGQPGPGYGPGGDRLPGP